MPRGRETLSAIWAIARDPSLTPVQARLWIVYRSYDTRGEGAWPGDATLAEHMGVSERTVQRERVRLLERGYLTRELRGPRPAVWRAALPEWLRPEPQRLEPEAVKAGLKRSANGPKRREQLEAALEQVRRQDRSFRGGLPDPHSTGIEIRPRDYEAWNEVLKEAGFSVIGEANGPPLGPYSQGAIIGGRRAAQGPPLGPIGRALAARALAARQTKYDGHRGRRIEPDADPDQRGDEAEAEA